MIAPQLLPKRHERSSARWRTASRPSTFCLWALSLAAALVVTACGGARSLGSPEPAALPPGSTGVESLSPSPAALALQPARSPGQAIQFRRLTLDDGLSQSTINCIVQDAQGFMWFGTEDGLNRYDGYTVRIYRNDPENPYSPSANHVLKCIRTEHGSGGATWFATLDGTLHRYEPERDGFIRYDLPLEDPFQQNGNVFTTYLADSQGRLWIGTFGDGLLRYDADQDRFIIYRHDPADPASLSHRIVTRILEDHQGTIWIGTEGGLNRYDADGDRFERYPYRDFPPNGYQYDPPVHTYDPAFQPDNPHALSSPAVTALLEDQQHRLWVGTRYGGLNLLDRETGLFSAYPYDPDDEPANPSSFSGNSVRALLQDRLGQIWVSSAHWNVDQTRTYARLGLERLDPQTGAILRYPADPDDPCSLPHQAILLMHEDAQGMLWFHTFGGGVEVYDRATGCFRHYGHVRGNEQTLSSDDLTTFYQDEANGLWIGTAMGGVNYYDATSVKFPAYRIDAASTERQSNNSVFRIAPSPDGLFGDGHAHVLWLSTFAGVNRWDRRTDAFTFYEIDPKLPDTIAFSIYQDQERRTLWLGTSVGLERAKLPADSSVAPASLDFTRVLTRSSASTGLVADMRPTHDDHLWLALYRVGLSLFDLGTEQIVATYRHDPDNEQSLSDDRIRSLSEGASDTLWLVTSSGIDRFDPEQETFTHYLHDAQDPQSVAERVLALYQDQSGVVWLGTDQGLQRFDPTLGRVTVTYRQEQGLPNNVVYSILPERTGALWISTNKGLARFDPQTESFESYTAQDGLQSNEFNQGAHYGAPDGELFFGGVDGINAFYPYQIAADPHVPPIAITEISVGPPKPAGSTGTSTHTLNPFDGVEVSYRDRILSFEYAALHYALPERNQYAYKMEGFDREWNYVGNRRYAIYTNLPPGRYTFRVKGSNSDGVWNERGTAVAVTVTPPVWATWWFRGLAGLLLVGLAVGGYRFQVRRIETRNRLLERQVAERTGELAAVNSIAAVASSSLDLNALLADALSKTLEVMRIPAGGVYLLDQPAGVLTLAAQQGVGAEMAAEIDGLRLGEGFSGHVAQSGQPLVVQNAYQDPRLTRRAVQAQKPRSLAAVPLVAKDKILGTLFAVTQSEHEFTDRQVDLLTSIGQQIGVAVDNAVMYEAEQRRAEQFRVVGEVSRHITSILPVDELLDEIVRLIKASFGYYLVTVGLIEDDEVVFKAGAKTDWPQEQFLPPSLQVGSTGITAWVAATGRPLLAPDVSKDPRYRFLPDSSETRSELAVPLLAKTGVIGVLNVESDRVNAFDETDVQILQSLANQAAIAIENARLYEQAQRRMRELEALYRADSELYRYLDLDDVLQAVVNIAVDTLRADKSALLFWDPERKQWVTRAARGFSPKTIPLLSFARNEGTIGHTAASRKAVIIQDALLDPRRQDERPQVMRALLNSEGIRSLMHLPIQLGDEVLGILTVGFTVENALSPARIRLFGTVAARAALAIENAQLHEQTREIAVVQERSRLARELHDAVTQTLFSGSLISEALPAVWESDQEEGKLLLQELRQLSRGALAEMRTLLLELRPTALTEADMHELLRQLGTAVTGRTGVPVEVTIEGRCDLPDDVHVSIYRIAQEALNNVVKHSRASQIQVRLCCIEPSSEAACGPGIELQVRDDGIGFESSDVEPGELGLGIMQERAQAVGAELSITSQPGQGTTVTVVWKG